MKVNILSAVAAALAFAMTGSVVAQESYPSKNVKVIVPIPGGPDAPMRMIVSELEKRLGQSWVVDNRPGASLTVGGQACSVAEPDGHTLCILASDNITVLPHVMKALPYDADTSFKPIALLYYNIDGLVASRKVPANSVEELKAYAKANPGKLNFGTIGPGTTADMFRNWIMRDWDARIAAIPYRGGALVGKALAANEIDVSRLGLVSFVGPIKSGHVRVFAVGSKQRTPMLPDVPTYAEAGIGFPIKVWWGMFAPAGTPDAITNKINQEINAVLADPALRERMAKLYIEPAGGSVAEMASVIETDSKSTAQIVKSFGIQKR